jgi:hypothetical protein
VFLDYAVRVRLAGISGLSPGWADEEVSDTVVVYCLSHGCVETSTVGQIQLKAVRTKGVDNTSLRKFT